MFPGISLPGLDSLTSGGALVPSSSAYATSGPVSTGAVSFGGGSQQTLILAGLALAVVYLVMRK